MTMHRLHRFPNAKRLQYVQLCPACTCQFVQGMPSAPPTDAAMAAQRLFRRRGAGRYLRHALRACVGTGDYNTY